MLKNTGTDTFLEDAMRAISAYESQKNITTQYAVRQVLTDDEIVFATKAVYDVAMQYLGLANKAKQALDKGDNSVDVNGYENLYGGKTMEGLSPIYVLATSELISEILSEIADNLEVDYYKIFCDKFAVNDYRDRVRREIINNLSRELISARANQTNNIN